MEQKRTITVLLDDIDGTEEASTVKFGLDGKSYKIELSEKNEAKLRKFLMPYVEHARIDRTKKRSNGSRRNGPSEAEIRAWAAENGIEVKNIGRVPNAVREQYQAAH